MIDYTFYLEVTIDGRVYELWVERDAHVVFRPGDEFSTSQGTSLQVDRVLWQGFDDPKETLAKAAIVYLKPIRLRGKKEDWDKAALDTLGFQCALDQCSQWNE